MGVQPGARAGGNPYLLKVKGRKLDGRDEAAKDCKMGKYRDSEAGDKKRMENRQKTAGRNFPRCVQSETKSPASRETRTLLSGQGKEADESPLPSPRRRNAQLPLEEIGEEEKEAG